jgi:hypothetical protein
MEKIVDDYLSSIVLGDLQQQGDKIYDKNWRVQQRIKK